MAPGDLNTSYLVSGGSEAVETAIKIARQYHVVRGKAQKHLVISRWESYHGMTLGALSVAGGPGSRSTFAPMLQQRRTSVSRASWDVLWTCHSRRMRCFVRRNRKRLSTMPGHRMLRPSWPRRWALEKITAWCRQRRTGRPSGTSAIAMTCCSLPMRW